MVGRLGGFHFNDSKYGDDDLTVGSIKPFQLFLIWCADLVRGRVGARRLAYMIDESHNLKDPLEDLIQATDAIQVELAHALCVDRDALADAQQANDPARCRRRAAPGRSGPTSGRWSPKARRRKWRRLEPAGHLRAVGLPRRGTRSRARAVAVGDRASDRRSVAGRRRPSTSARPRCGCAGCELGSGPAAVAGHRTLQPLPVAGARWGVRRHCAWDWPRLVAETERGLAAALALGPLASDRLWTRGASTTGCSTARGAGGAAVLVPDHRTDGLGRGGPTRLGAAALYAPHRRAARSRSTPLLPGGGPRPADERDAGPPSALLPSWSFHHLTGAITGEPTSAGTTALVDIRAGSVVGVAWPPGSGSTRPLLRRHPPGGHPGRDLRWCRCTLVGGHDTASAVAAMGAARGPRPRSVGRDLAAGRPGAGRRRT
jgi:hypothetical protein